MYFILYVNFANCVKSIYPNTIISNIVSFAMFLSVKLEKDNK